MVLAKMREALPGEFLSAQQLFPSTEKEKFSLMNFCYPGTKLGKTWPEEFLSARQACPEKGVLCQLEFCPFSSSCRENNTERTQLEQSGDSSSPAPCFQTQAPGESLTSRAVYQWLLPTPTPQRMPLVVGETWSLDREVPSSP